MPASIGFMSELVAYWVSEMPCSTARTMFNTESLLKLGQSSGDMLPKTFVASTTLSRRPGWRCLAATGK